jgi:ribosomal-protein-alanine N-acetyltransferase
MRWTDLPGVHQIERTAFPDSAWSLETFWAELARCPQTRAYWVAERDGELAGYVGLMALPPDADVQTIAVSAPHRRRGVAGRLLDAAVDEAVHRSCASLMLEVGASNDAAIALYRRHGFEQVGRRASYYGPGRDAVLMRRRLSPPTTSGESVT